VERGGRSCCGLRIPFSLESLFFEYGDLVQRPLQHQRVRHAAGTGVHRAGPREPLRRAATVLYIGATDQDRRESVLSATAATTDVPISLAIQAR